MLDDEELADHIVRQIIDDLASRKGIGDEWSTIDSKTRKEISAEWRAFVIAGLQGRKAESR